MQDEVIQTDISCFLWLRSFAVWQVGKMPPPPNPRAGLEFKELNVKRSGNY